MKIIVTGGSGFIGTNLVEGLIKSGHEVVIFDKKISEKYPGLCILGDVRDREKLVQVMKNIDAIFHLAAEHRDDVYPASLYYEVNEGGAENVVFAANCYNIRKLIYTSSAAVYGLNVGEKNEQGPIHPFNDYGKSKYKAEIIFSEWLEKSENRNLSIVRPSVIFGEKNRGNVYNLFKQIVSGRFIMVGSGENRKSMGYVLNLTSFLENLLLMRPGKYVYNYADKPDLSINELIKISYKVLGKKQTNVFRLPYKVGMIGGFGFDIISRLTAKKYPISSIRIKKFCSETLISSEKLKETRFSAPYTLIEGLERTISSEFHIVNK